MTKLITIICLIACFSTSAFSQFNLKVGGDIGIIIDPIDNGMYDRANIAYPWLDNDFEHLTGLFGVNFGMRYRFGAASLEASYRNKTNRITAKGFAPGQLVAEETDITYKINSFSIGTDFYIDQVSFGGTLDYNFFVVNAQRSFDAARREIITQRPLSSHFHFTYEFKGSDAIRVAIRPYYHLFWDQINIFNLERELFPETNHLPADFDTNYNSFGISFLFFNGKQ